MIQPRIRNHPDLAPLNNDALATVRALTCLNESGTPELLARYCAWPLAKIMSWTIFTPAVSLPAISLETGCLGLASNLGMDCGLGWLDRHPDSGAQIEGLRLPYWGEFRSFTEKAHCAFADRILVGWDVAITPTV